jgi:hypothetical protein
MKQLAIISLIVSSFLLFPKTVEATFAHLCHKTGNGYIYLVVATSAKQSHINHGDYTYDGPDYSEENSDVKRLFLKSKWCNTSETPAPSSSAEPSTSPSDNPEATASPTPTSSPNPTHTPESSSSATPATRTDLSDGRSDGKTDSLGCQNVSDNCAQNKGTTTLPATGSHAVEYSGLAGLVALLGIGLRKIAGRT